MEKYREHYKCPKCGHINFQDEYRCPDYLAADENVKEYIRRVCLNCGFETKQLPLDAKDELPLSQKYDTGDC